MGFLARQCVDETGRQAVRLERWIFVALAIYFVHIVIAFVQTSVYSTSLIGPIFSIAGLLYIGILAIELVIGLIGTALWVVEGVVIKNTTIQVIGAPDRGDKISFYLAVVLAATIPIVILVNLYCLVQAAKLKIILKEEKKQLKSLAIDERVLLMAQDLVVQHLQAYSIPSSPPLSHNNHHHHHHRSRAKQSRKLKQTQVVTPPIHSNINNNDEVHIDMSPGGSSAM